jgi:hypothetical protein
MTCRRWQTRHCELPSDMVGAGQDPALRGALFNSPTARAHCVFGGGSGEVTGGFERMRRPTAFNACTSV